MVENQFGKHTRTTFSIQTGTISKNARININIIQPCAEHTLKQLNTIAVHVVSVSVVLLTHHLWGLLFHAGGREQRVHTTYCDAGGGCVRPRVPRETLCWGCAGSQRPPIPVILIRAARIWRGTLKFRRK